MDEDLWASTIALVVLAALAAGTSAGLAAWRRLNRGRLKHLANEGQTRAGDLLRLVDSPGSTSATLLIGNAGAIVAVAMVGIVVDQRYLGGNPALFWAVAVAAFFLLLWLQLTANAIGYLHPDTTMLALLWPLRSLDLLLRPFTAVLRPLARLAVRADPHQSLEAGIAADEDIRMIVEAVEEEGNLQENEKEMIHSIFELGEMTAREIMVPRVDVVAVEASEPLRRVLERIYERGHSRIPIYEETIDNIVGIVYAKDLLHHMEAGSLDEPARLLGRAPHFIPEAKKTDELLKEMQRNRVHIAVVLDEYGGTSGIVTIEDLLEEIVGEIQDEYDAEEISIQKVSDTEAVVDARVSIRDVDETLDVTLGDGEYDTIGGLVYDHLGKIPVVGDEVRVADLLLTVLSTSGKRINKVKLRVEPDTPRE